MDWFIIFFMSITFFLSFLIVFSSLNHQNLFLDKLTDKFSVISGFFITAALYLTYLMYLSNINNSNKDMTFNIIDRGWININFKILENYNLCPNFADSLYFDWQKVNN